MAVGRLNPGRIFRLGAFAEVTRLGSSKSLENISLRYCRFLVKDY